MRFFTGIALSYLVLSMPSKFVNTHNDSKYEYLLPFCYSHFLTKKCATIYNCNTLNIIVYDVEICVPSLLSVTASIIPSLFVFLVIVNKC